MQDVEMQDVKMTDQVTRHENAGHEIVINFNSVLMLYQLQNVQLSD